MIQPFPVLASAEMIVDLVPHLSLGIDDTATEQTEAHDEGVFGNTNSCTAQRWKSYARTLAEGLDAVSFTEMTKLLPWRMASKLLTRKCLRQQYRKEENVEYNGV